MRTCWLIGPFHVCLQCVSSSVCNKRKVKKKRKDRQQATPFIGVVEPALLKSQHRDISTTSRSTETTFFCCFSQYHHPLCSFSFSICHAMKENKKSPAFRRVRRLLLKRSMYILNTCLFKKEKHICLTRFLWVSIREVTMTFPSRNSNGSSRRCYIKA